MIKNRKNLFFSNSCGKENVNYLKLQKDIYRKYDIFIDIAKSMQ